VLTSTHAALALALTGRRDVALGAVLPDLPAFAAGAWLAARRVPRGAFVQRLYHRPPLREAHRAGHSVPLALALLATGRARGVALGWLSHLAVDGLTHHDDAWPLLWPLSGARWRSPVSYWQPAHHARALQAVEVAALLALRRPLAAAVAAVPLVRGSRSGVAGVAGVAVTSYSVQEKQRDVAEGRSRS
jgi:hypothetical protein